MYYTSQLRRDGRAVECTSLENWHTLIAYLGFKSLSLRHLTHRSDDQPQCKIAIKTISNHAANPATANHSKNIILLYSFAKIIDLLLTSALIFKIFI